MKLTLLGTGTPRPSAERMATANLVQVNSKNILFDAGRGVSVQLARIGMHPRDIDQVFITHHHFDHIAGLDDLLLSAWSDGRTTPVKVLGPPGTSAIIDTFWSGIYARDINFRRCESARIGTPLADIRALIRPRDITAGEVCQIGDMTVIGHAVEHGHALGLSHEDWPCFGYRIKVGNTVLAISGDSIDCPGLRRLAAGADLLLQCCYLAGAEIDNPDNQLLVETILASAPQAGAVAAAAGVDKLVLTHIPPKDPALLDAMLREIAEIFSGETILGADLMRFEL